MHKLLDEYLVNKYPKIFAERNKPPQETCMCWGFPGDGWFYLLDSLCAQIQYRIDNPPHSVKKCFYNKCVRLWVDYVWNTVLWRIFGRANKLNRFQKYLCPQLKYGPENIPQVVAHQVKEKFGTLRFYYSGGDEVIYGMIKSAEYLSGFICEDCGEFNENVGQTPGWISTICTKCVKRVNLNEEGLIAFEESRNPELVKIWEIVRQRHKESLRKRKKKQ